MSEAAHEKPGHGAGDAAGGGGHKKHKKHHPAHAPHEEHEEGWIVSFADNVLLMMGFFVILLAMNMGPKGSDSSGDPNSPANAPNDNMLDFAIAMREAFHNPVDLGSDHPNDQALIRRLRQRANSGDTSRPGPEGDRRNVQSIRPSDWAGPAGHVEFGDQSSDLSAAARSSLAQLSTQIVGTRWIVEVRGHASKLESFGDARKARQLSYDRSYAVAHELVQHGARWEQIQLIASGDVYPVTPRAQSAGEHAANQRVEILITPLSMPSDPYAQPDNADR